MSVMGEVLSGLVLIAAVAVGSGPGALPGAESAPIPGATQPELVFEDASYRELALGDIEGAIRGYREVLAAATAPESLRARAHLRLGICHRLRGEAQLARSELETVVERYPLEVEAVSLARRYLGRREADDPAAYMPPDALAYVELVEPAQRVRAISLILEGTPFQNPIDTYVSYLTGRGPGRLDGPRDAASDGQGAASLGSDRPGGATLPESGGDAAASEGRDREVSPAAAFLNEGFLRELQKIGGLALAIPVERRNDDEFVAVFLPGSSDILIGLVQMLLTLSDARGVGVAHGVPILRARPMQGPAPEDRDEWLHVAIGPSFVIAGRPRNLVESAVARSATDAPSLADNLDFRRAQAARSGSVLFSYVNSKQVLALIRERTKPEDRPALEAFCRGLGLDQVYSLSFTVSYAESEDSLRLSLRARFDGKGLEDWAAFRTPPLDSALLAALPRKSALYVASRLDDDPPRDEVLKLLDRSIPDSPDPKKQQDAEALREILRSPECRSFFEELDALAVGSLGEPMLPQPLGSFAILRFRSLEGGPKALEDLVTSLLRRLAAKPASEAFDAEKVYLDGKEETVRSIELQPGLRLRYRRIGDLIALGLSEGALVDPRRAGQPAPKDEAVPSRAAKVLVVRPAAILRSQMGTAGIPPDLWTLVLAVERAIISTREGRESFSLDLTIPAVTPVARAALNKLAEIDRSR